MSETLGGQWTSIPLSPVVDLVTWMQVNDYVEGGDAVNNFQLSNPV